MPKRSQSNGSTIPAPYMGWNTLDTKSMMDPLYCPDCDNFFSNGGQVEIRKGSRYHSKSIDSGKVMTVGALALATGVKKLISIGNGGSLTDTGNVFDSTAAGAATNITPAGPDPAWQVNQVTVFRNRAFIAGNDTGSKCFTWDGAAATFTSAGFTGLPTRTRLIAPYRSRLYFAPAIIGTSALLPASLTLSYGGVDAITGATTTFDYSSICTKGGNPAFIGPLSRTAQATDELFCIITTEGEVLIYQGSYPASATWGLVNRLFIPRPLGHRPAFYYGSDILVITRQGLVSINELMQGSPIPKFLTEKISDQFTSTMVATTNTLPYICGVYAEDQNCIVINVPTTDSTTPTMVQFVMDTRTGGWWKWTGLTAYHWAVWDGNLVFGSSNGRAFKAFTGYYDENPASEGAMLTRNIKLKHAFNYFGDRLLNKQFTEARPNLYQDQGLDIKMDVDVNFGDTAATSQVTDLTDTNYKYYYPTMGLRGIGRCASVRIDGTVTEKRFALESTDVLWIDADVN